MRKYILLSLSVVAVLLLHCSCTRTPAKTSSDSEKLAWWSEARYGMFVHWGISSLTGQEISWSRQGYGASKYDSLALRFNPASFDADKWIDIAEAAGMKYIVLTTKHHDGFCLWDSKANSFNIMNTPYGKDICRQLADAAHRRGMRLGWYFSTREWSDENCCTEGKTAVYVEKMKQELTELLTNYGKVDLLWFDFDGWISPVKPQEIVNLIRRLQPDIIYNNRLYPISTDESHASVGDFGMYCTPEQFVGGYGTVPWESCSTMGESRQWSVRYGDAPRPAKDLIWETIGAAGGNGNMLMNVGPDSLGVIPPIFAERLAEVGSWINAHDGILYGTTCGPWKPTAKYVSTMKDGKSWLLLREGSDIVLPFSKEYRIAGISTDSGAEVSFTSEEGSVLIDIPAELEGACNVALRVSFDGEVPAEGSFAPFGTSGSKAYGCKASASSSINEKYMHCPSSAFDDMGNTAWVPGRRSDGYADSLYGHVIHYMDDKESEEAYEQNATLEADLGSAMEISSFMIKGRRKFDSAALEYFSEGKWVEVARTAPLEGKWTGEFPAVSAQKWRLNLSGTHMLSGISEFQLY